MSHTNALNEIPGLCGLWVVCRPESPEVLADPVPAIAGVSIRWEYAVSRSAAEAGRCPEIGRRGRFFGTHDQETICAKMELYDLVVVQPLSLNSLAKIALGIRDSLPAAVVLTALAAGKPLFLAQEGMDAATAGMHPHLTKLYRRYWQDLTGGPVIGFTRAGLPEKLEVWFRRRRDALRLSAERRAGRPVITRDDVREAWQAMVPLVIPRGALLTDLAREEAGALGVTLRIEEP
ncbi:MAG TPA: flavoprotein [Candidatus Ozemobacteraceae bacterium]|nr:flavoprotein [Candidatus Ozemobacteraceae bacterium]